VSRRGGSQQIVLSDATVFEQQIQHFCQALLEGSEFLVQEDDVRTGIAIIEQCYADPVADARAVT
jgi:hypothetical protein